MSPQDSKPHVISSDEKREINPRNYDDCCYIVDVIKQKVGEDVATAELGIWSSGPSTSTGPSRIYSEEWYLKQKRGSANLVDLLANRQIRGRRTRTPQCKLNRDIYTSVPLIRGSVVAEMISRDHIVTWTPDGTRLICYSAHLDIVRVYFYKGVQSSRNVPEEQVLTSLFELEFEVKPPVSDGFQLRLDSLYFTGSGRFFVVGASAQVAEANVELNIAFQNNESINMASGNLENLSLICVDLETKQIVGESSRDVPEEQRSLLVNAVGMEDDEMENVACIICGDTLSLNSRMSKCPAKNGSCARDICVACLVKEIDKIKTGHYFCFCCHAQASLQAFSRVIGAKNNVELQIRAVPEVIVENPRNQPEAGLKYTKVVCIRQDPASDQTKRKCPECPRLYHTGCILEEIHIAEQHSDQFVCKCGCARSHEWWRGYVANPAIVDDLR